MGLASHKLNGATNTGADIDDKYNALIDALLSVFDIDSNVQTYSTTPKTDAIAEATADAGVTIDGCEIKDGNAAKAFGVTGVDDSTIEISSNKLQSKLFTKTYDSGWFAVVRSTTYAKTHNLGTTKLLVLVYFSNAADGSTHNTLVDVQNDHSEYDGVQVTDITTTTFNIETLGNAICREWNAGSATDYTTGYLRVIAIALA